MTKSVPTRKSAEVPSDTPINSTDWERLTRLEFVVQQLVKDYERMDTRIDEISKSQEKITKLIQSTRYWIFTGFGAILLQAPELVKYLPEILKLMSAN